eukprot:TRINITY_DN59656_c0_g1_i1.p2 TRINITY_DN59656_c0_g1~~TRINITY_DN59656_c0_g1_i1.p2  ORF type:complete len:186 (+),score=21.79 TRINITY_DN59656_c0_g1_i1:54-611(+)
MYLRPSECLRTSTDDVLQPTNKMKTWGVIIGTPDQPAKDTEIDDSVFAGGKKWEWLAYALESLWKATPANSLLFADLSLASFEHCMRKTMQKLGLEDLSLTPYTARHGSASLDHYANTMSLREIQRRGRWKSQASVARYNKSGKLQRQVNKLTNIQIRNAEDIEVNLEGRLIKTINHLPVLRERP